VKAGHLLEGRLGERLACRALIARGYDILARRYRGRLGELDLVAYHGAAIAFIEVKTRSTRHFGEPWEFVDREKRQRIKATAEEFIARHGLGAWSYRFDVVSVVAPGTPHEEITILCDAF
jgi:putative endonuclease